MISIRCQCSIWPLCQCDALSSIIPVFFCSSFFTVLILLSRAFLIFSHIFLFKFFVVVIVVVAGAVAVAGSADIGRVTLSKIAVALHPLILGIFLSEECHRFIATIRES